MTQKTTRKSIPKQIRFEVFKRDSFTCQYCGRKAPEVILHVDHIDPVSKGGDNCIINLLTSCEPCNLGKSDIPLDAQKRIEKERTQLDVLQQRREQLQMIAEWRKGLREISNDENVILADEWGQAFGWEPQEFHLRQISLLCKRAGFQMALEVIAKTGCHYADSDNDQIAKKLRAIERSIAMDAVSPGRSKIPYIMGIMANKSGSKMWLSEISGMLERLFGHERFDIDKALQVAKTCCGKGEYRDILQAAVSDIFGNGQKL